MIPKNKHRMKQEEYVKNYWKDDRWYKIFATGDDRIQKAVRVHSVSNLRIQLPQITMRHSITATWQACLEDIPFFQVAKTSQTSSSNNFVIAGLPVPY